MKQRGKPGIDGKRAAASAAAAATAASGDGSGDGSSRCESCRRCQLRMHFPPCFRARLSLSPSLTHFILQVLPSSAAGLSLRRERVWIVNSFPCLPFSQPACLAVTASAIRCFSGGEDAAAAACACLCVHGLLVPPLFSHSFAVLLLSLSHPGTACDIRICCRGCCCWERAARSRLLD